MSLYLIAILPPEEIDKQVSSWKEFMLNRYGCRVALKSPAHITLIPPFHLADEKADGLMQLLDLLAKRFKTFDLQLKDFAAFAPRVIYVYVQADERLDALKQSLEDEMMRNGYPVKKEDRAYHPHVTIANRDLSKQDFPGAWGHFKNLRYQENFTVRAITLLKHNGQIWSKSADAILPQK